MAARKTSSAPTWIWTYHATIDGSDELVFSLLRAANRYYNRLVEIERARHARFAEIRRRYAPELASLEEQWEAADERIGQLIRDVKLERARHWQETGGERRRLRIDEMESEIDALKAAQKRLSAEAKAHRASFDALTKGARKALADRSLARAWVSSGAFASEEDGLAAIAAHERAVEEAKALGRKPAASSLPTAAPRHKATANTKVLAAMLSEPQWPEAWKEIARSDDEAHRALLAARESCGLPTGTYLAVEEAFARAKKDSSPRPPRFRSFSGEGKLSVQLRDVTYADLVAGTTQCTIRPNVKTDPTKKGRAPTLVSLAQHIPRGEKHELRLVLRHDREPPTDAAVKWASLIVRRTGRRHRFEFQLTLEDPSFALPKRPAGTRPPEHIQIGWARVDGGVRIAHWPSGDVVVPDSILDQHDHAAAIESAADRHFDRAKKLLRRWMRSGPHRLTAWHRMLSDRARGQLRHACIAFAEWGLGAERLRTLWRSWKTDRLSRGEDLYTHPWLVRRWLSRAGVEDQEAVVGFWAYLWARKDEHLCQYAVDSRRRFVNRRDAFFRREAIRIATEFESVTVDSYSIARLKELPTLTMPGDPPRDQAQHNVQAAAPGRFRELLLEVMGPRCTKRERPSDETNAGGARKRKARGGKEKSGSDESEASAAE